MDHTHTEKERLGQIEKLDHSEMTYCKTKWLLVNALTTNIH